MKYLLDVNTLIAPGFLEPAFHHRVASWVRGLTRFELLTCPITEDDHDVSRLPHWAKTGRQTTDGHLAELASAHGAVLATMDEKIPGAFVIPPENSALAQ
jgi:predicted nucleic acid-binding protein